MELEEIRDRRDKKVARFRKSLGVIMALFYLTVAFLFAFLPLNLGVSENVRWMFVAFSGLYGIFRLYRSIA